MNFSENLQSLRKGANLSQEQLAEKLGVSRQAVSKWESGSGYPETDKLIAICDIFECSMDVLLKGEIEKDTTGLKKKYEELYNITSKGIAIGVGIILLGVILLLMFTNISIGKSVINFERFELFGVVLLLICVTIAVPIFICVGIKNENFRKKHKQLPEFYTENELDKFNERFPIAIATGVTLILIGVIILISLYGLEIVSNESIIPVNILLSFVLVAVDIFIYFGIQKEKYNISQYNKLEKIRERDAIVEQISGVIMLIATALYLGLSFTYHNWHISWIVFPIGGILCGIISEVFKNVKEEK